MSMRVAVIGALRRRQGTGEYVARELSRLGVEVSAIVGTQQASVAEAQGVLEERYGIAAAGYTSLEALLAEEALDGVAICSPAEHHLDALERAAAAGLHVFCEKPLWWDPTLAASDDVEATAARVGAILDALAAAGRTLHVNAQWPYTLEAFRALHPGAYGEGRPVERVAMELSPTSEGVAMIVESASHPISMVHALVGPGAIEAVEVATTPPVDGVAGWRLAWTHQAASGPVNVALTLAHGPAVPRPAAYAINGETARRRVRLPEYTITFAAGDREVPVRDPLVASVEAFVRRAEEGSSPDRDAVVEGMTHLQALIRAAVREVR